MMHYSGEYQPEVMLQSMQGEGERSMQGGGGYKLQTKLPTISIGISPGKQGIMIPFQPGSTLLEGGDGLSQEEIMQESGEYKPEVCGGWCAVGWEDVNATQYIQWSEG